MKIRQAIIERKAIFDPKLRKIKIRSNPCRFSNIDLGKSSYLITHDCSNNEFIYFNKLCNSSKRAIKHYLDTATEVPYAYINVNLIKNFEYILWIVKEFVKRNIPVYIETSIDLPDFILDELSKNTFNVIQCNITELSNSENDYESAEAYRSISRLRELPYKSKINGIYTVISISPIIPSITKLESILTVLAAEKYNYNHLIFQFISIPKKLNTTEYVKFNNIKIDSSYFELDGNVWNCAKWYKDLIKENIKYFVQDAEYCICDEKSNCRGIPIVNSYRDEDDLFYLKTR